MAQKTADYAFEPPTDIVPPGSTKIPRPPYQDRPPRRDEPVPAQRDATPSDTEGLLVLHAVVLTKRNLALAAGQGARVWKYGSMWGLGFEPVTVWALTAPVFLKDGGEMEFLMDPSCPHPSISFSDLRNGVLDPTLLEVAKRYPMDGRGMQVRVKAANCTGILPVLKHEGVGASLAGWQEEPLVPAQFMRRVSDLTAFDAPLVLPAYYRRDPEGKLWMWDILKGTPRRVSPVNLPFSMQPGDDFLSEEMLEAVRSKGWEARLSRDLQKGFLDSNTNEIYFGYAVRNPDDMTTQKYTPQDMGQRLTGATIPLLQRQSLGPLAGDARRIVAEILGVDAPWKFEPSHQTM